MKMIFARLICLNAVILLTSGILFGATDLKPSFSTSTKNTHYSSKTDLSVDSFSFFEEDEEEDEDHHLDLTFLFDCNHNIRFSGNTKLENLNQFTSKYQPNITDKTPIWIKIRHIII